MGYDRFAGSIDWSHWYVFPFAITVAITANASGFSGSVLFQPFFNFILGLPIGHSIATGVATETIGMTSGASRYLMMRKIDMAAARTLLPTVLVGVAAGLFVFVRASRDLLRLLVGLVVGGIALVQLDNAGRRVYGTVPSAILEALRRYRPRSFWAGVSSACTGTGVAEIHRPLLEHGGGLPPRGQTRRRSSSRPSPTGRSRWSTCRLGTCDSTSWSSAPRAS